MASNVVETSNNHRLPFDILGLIFKRYEAEFEYPLETILSVCQSWRDAAVGHCSLWTSNNVIIGHDKSFNYCIKYVKKRLILSGDRLPLRITIAIVNSYPHNSPQSTISKHLIQSGGLIDSDCCTKKAGNLACYLLELLAGRSGEGCHRWASLKLHLGQNYFSANGHSDLSLKSLTYPTPLLENVHLENLQLSGHILPFCPALDAITLNHAIIPYLLDISRTKWMSFHWDHGRRWEQQNLANLEAASKLAALKLDFAANQRFTFPPSLPSVRYLYLLGDTYPLDFNQSSFPNLRFLSIQLCREEDIRAITEAPGIPFPQIRHLEIIWREHVVHMSAMRARLRSLLLKTSSVSHLTFDDFPLATLLNLLWTTRGKLDNKKPSTTIAPFHRRLIKLQRYRFREPVEEAPLGVYTQQELVHLAEKMRVSSPIDNWSKIMDNQMALTR